MKTKSIIIIASLLILAGVGTWFYLKRDKVPQLLERQGELSMSAEWKNTQAAIQTLQQKIRQNPKDYKSKLMLAYAFMQEARVTGEHPYYYPEAMSLVDDILDNVEKTDDLYYEALISKASIQLSLHHFKDALVTGTEALSIKQDDNDLYGVLCDANVELGNYPEAIKMGDKMVSLRPDLQSYSRVSYLREIHGDMPGAIEAMKLAVSAGYPGQEQTCWACCTLAKLHTRLGDTAEAAKIYRHALRDNPGYGFAIAGLADLKVRAKNYPAAINLYTKALNIIPEFSFQEEMAKIYQLQGNEALAKDATDKTIKMLEEDEAAGHYADLELANLHLNLTKDYDKALSYAEREQKRRPENIDVNRVLALTSKKLGNEEAFKQYSAKAMRTKKFDPELSAMLAQK